MARFGCIAGGCLLVATAFMPGHATADTIVGYDPAAGTGNFGSPSAGSNQVAYSVSLSEDATNLYGTIAVRPDLGGTYDPGKLFANLYFGVGVSASAHSRLGIEVVNNDAFYPGGAGPVSLAGTGFGFTTNATTGVITFTLPWSFLETDPLGIGFDKISAANPDVILRLSQSLGYTVAGGSGNFGADVLGIETLPALVPEPASFAMLATALTAATLARLRKRG